MFGKKYKKFLLGLLVGVMTIIPAGYSTQAQAAVDEAGAAEHWTDEELEQRFAGFEEDMEDAEVSVSSVEYDWDDDDSDDGEDFDDGEDSDDGEDADDEEDSEGYATADEPDEEKDPVYVNLINITDCYTGVMAGSAPKYTAVSSEREKYRILCEGWESEDGEFNFSQAAAYLPTDTVFSSFSFGMKYSYNLAVQMQAEYYLTDDARIMVNGSYIPTANVRISSDCRRIYVLNTFSTEARCQHDYKTTVLEEAGCESEGTCQKTCKICGYSCLEDIPAVGHKDKTVVTKATLSANGYTVQKCSVCGRETGKQMIYKPASFKIPNCDYTGKALKPTIVVKDSKGNKISDSYYSVTYSSNKNVGTGKATVKFKGHYSGTKTLNFTIRPTATTISSLTACSKSFSAKWSKKTTQTSGYQIQYSTSKSFSSGVVTRDITKNTTVSQTITSLSSKKTYYVRVRTYKTVGGKRICSTWSAAQSVKTK